MKVILVFKDGTKIKYETKRDDVARIIYPREVQYGDTRMMVIVTLDLVEGTNIYKEV